MKFKKTIAVMITVFIMIAFSSVASADTLLEFSAGDASTVLGGTVSVPVNLVSYVRTESVGCKVIYDPDVLTYDGFENTLQVSENDYEIYFKPDEPGEIEVSIIRGYKAYDGTLFTFNFTATDDIGDAITAETDITVAFIIGHCLDEDYIEIPEEALTFSSGKVSIIKEHTAPTLGAVSIEGSGEAGDPLTAVPADFDDNWHLEPIYSYEWTVDGTVVSTEETYTPTPADVDRTVTVSVKATVDAPEPNESEAKTASILVSPSTSQTARVGNLKFSPSDVKVDVPVTVSYDFIPSTNGGEDASAIVWTNQIGEVLAEGTAYTPSFNDYANGVVLTVTVKPKGSNDTAPGTPQTKSAPVTVFKPEVSNVTLGTLKTDVPATVTYDFSAVGEGENYEEGETEIKFYKKDAAGDVLLETQADGSVVIDGAAITLDSSYGDAVVYATVTPVNKYGIRGETVKSNEETVRTYKIKDIEVITGKNGAAVYSGYLEGTNVIVTIEATGIDPDARKVFVDGVEFYYVASRDYFVGVIPRYDGMDPAAVVYKEAVEAAITVEDGASERIVYGKDPNVPEKLNNPVTAVDFGAAKRISLKKVTSATPKMLLSADVGYGVMDGAVNAIDFGAIKRVSLKKDADFEINTKH